MALLCLNLREMLESWNSSFGGGFTLYKFEYFLKRNLQIQLGSKKDSLSSRFGGVIASYKFKYSLKRNLQIQLGIRKDLGNLAL